MQIKTATFKISNTDPKKCPQSDRPEYAFIGRSNVGKSSLINMLCGVKNLAKTSSKPGKTQLINHFEINNGDWLLVDLPGYGFAKVSKESRVKWQEMISKYLQVRENLYCTFVLLDARLEPQKIDLEFINWLGEKGIAFCIVYTKTDKISSAVLAKNKKLLLQKLLERWETPPTLFYTSAEKGRGKDEILNFIEETNANA